MSAPRTNLKKEPQITASYKEKNGESSITLLGEGAHVSISNALRRTIVADIPITCWHPLAVEIDKEGTKSYHNHDIIRNNIQCLPPPYDLANDFDVEDPQIYLPTPVIRQLYSGHFRDALDDEEVDLGGKTLSTVEMSCRVTNTDRTTRYVTTHDVKLIVDGQEVDNYRRYPPVAFMDLRGGESITFHATALVNISRVEPTFVAARLVRHEDLEPGWLLQYETLGQLTGKSIYHKACRILLRKTQIILSYLEERPDTIEMGGDREYHLRLYGEDDTMAAPITNTLTTVKGVITSAYSRRHLSDRDVVLKWTVREGVDGVELLLSTLRYLVALWKKIDV